MLKSLIKGVYIQWYKQRKRTSAKLHLQYVLYLKIWKFGQIFVVAKGICNQCLLFWLFLWYNRYQIRDMRLKAVIFIIFILLEERQPLQSPVFATPFVYLSVTDLVLLQTIWYGHFPKSVISLG